MTARYALVRPFGNDPIPADASATSGPIDTRRADRLSLIVDVDGIETSNEIQTATFSTGANAPTGGDFTIDFDGQVTAAIDYLPTNTLAARVTTALEALSNIGVGDVEVSFASPVLTIEFVGALAGANQPQITCDATGLTSDGDPATLTPATVTAGGVAPAVAIKIQATNYARPDQQQVNDDVWAANATWVDVASATLSWTGDDAKRLQVAPFSAGYIRLVYTFTSGTGGEMLAEVHVGDVA